MPDPLPPASVLAEQTAIKEKADRERFAAAKPTTTLLHSLAAHVAATPQQTRFDIALADGTKHEDVPAELFYTDGLTTVVHGERYFFPIASVVSIKIRMPKV